MRFYLPPCRQKNIATRGQRPESPPEAITFSEQKNPVLRKRTHPAESMEEMDEMDAGPHAEIHPTNCVKEKREFHGVT